MGGGTIGVQDVSGGHVGLSPRGRGNLTEEVLNDYISRSIPAWAGEPADALITHAALRVYPRVGGGTA